MITSSNEYRSTAGPANGNPRFQVSGQAVLYMFYNIAPQYQHFRLALGGHKGAYRTLNGTYQRLHEVAVVNKLKGHIFYGFFVLSSTE